MALKEVQAGEGGGATGTSESFVGRVREFGDLVGALEGPIAGRAAVRLLVGEPGIGKSRMAVEFISVAEARGFTCIWANCIEEGEAPPFWPWVQVLRGILDGLSESERATLLEDSEELSALLVRRRAAPAEEDHRSTMGDGRFEFFDSVAGLLRRAARERPLVLVFDDLHWSDAGSLELLAFATRQIQDVPIFVLGTYRGSDVALDNDLRTHFEGIARIGSRVHLGGLGESESGRLVEQIAEGPVPPRVAFALYTLTNGNPFFLDEVTRLLLVRGSLAKADPDSLRIPVEIGDVIVRRLDPLEAEAREHLKIAAVVGRRFSAALLAQMLGEPLALVLARLEECVRIGLLEEPFEGDRGTEFSFRHALVRQTLYQRLTPARRAALHGRAADGLEALHADNLDEVLPALASHLLHAAIDPHYRLLALDRAESAGRRAHAAFSFEQAKDYFERALAVLEQGPADPKRHMRLLLGLAGAMLELGLNAACRKLSAEALEIAREIDDPIGFARAAIGSTAGGENGMNPDLSKSSILEQALKLLGDKGGTMRARVLAQLAEALYFSDRHEEAVRYSREASELARELGDPHTLGFALRTEMWVSWRPDNARERAAVADRMIGIGQAAGSRQSLEYGLWARVDALLEQGDTRGVEAALAQADELVEETRQPRAVWIASNVHGACAALRGDFEDAEAHHQRSLAVGQAMDPELAGDWFGIQLFLLREMQGRYSEILPGLRELATRRPYPVVRSGLARMLVRAGEIDEAAAQLDALMAPDVWPPRCDVNWPFIVACLGEVCARAMRVEYAEQIYNEFLPFDGSHVVLGLRLGYSGPAAHALGLLAMALGKSADAERHLREALAQAQAAEARPFAATIERDLVRLIAADPTPASRDNLRDHVEHVVEEAEALGLRHLAEGLPSVGEGAEVASPAIDRRSKRTATLSREGDYWTLSAQHSEVRLRHVRGLSFLAELLGEPGREYHALELVGSADLPDRGVAPEDALDPRARAELRARVEVLRSELEEANQWNDIGRAARAREELDQLAGRLSADVGLGGRARRSGTPGERARVNATRALRVAVERIAKHYPELGVHLDRTVRTGMFCAYDPAPGDEVEWTVRP